MCLFLFLCNSHKHPYLNYLFVTLEFFNYNYYCRPVFLVIFLAVSLFPVILYLIFFSPSLFSCLWSLRGYFSSLFSSSLSYFFVIYFHMHSASWYSSLWYTSLWSSSLWTSSLWTSSSWFASSPLLWCHTFLVFPIFAKYVNLRLSLWAPGPSYRQAWAHVTTTVCLLHPHMTSGLRTAVKNAFLRRCPTNRLRAQLFRAPTVLYKHILSSLRRHFVYKNISLLEKFTS